MCRCCLTPTPERRPHPPVSHPSPWSLSLARPSVRDRLENLYFAYLFVLRAVTKAGPYMEHLDIDTGFPGEDAVTRELLVSLLHDPKLASACPLPFDETKVFVGEGGERRRAQMQSQFREITRVLDCVGCEKCKLWGKLQVLGMATALKINFHALRDVRTDADREPLVLERNEVVALLNFLARLSSSLETVRTQSSRVLFIEDADLWGTVPSTATWDPEMGDTDAMGAGRGLGPGAGRPGMVGLWPRDEL